MRTFRLDRIDGEISILKNGQAYDIPLGFDIFASLTDKERANNATLDIRKGKAELLRKKAQSVTEKGEWDQITLNYSNERAFIDLVLWHGQDVLVIEPYTLRRSIIACLQEIVALHE